MVYERRLWMKSKLARRIWLVAALIVVGAAIVACQPADQVVDQPTQPATETATEQPEPDIDEPAPTETETETSAAQDPGATDEVEADEQEAEEEEQAAPTARIGLVATNPAEVELASGEIQLVEFFAFW
jgi:cytoskeletal protein RodZ